MSGLKFWKGYENLRSVYKNCFPKYWAISSIFELLSSQKGSLFLLQYENIISLNKSNGVSKNPSFHTDFKNVHMTLVKSAPKKSFSQKTILPIKNLPKSYKYKFFGKNFFCVHFLQRSCAHFWNCYKKTKV
jgi:hypothetical protein